LPVAGVAVRVTVAFAVKYFVCEAQVVPQLTPVGELLTVPLPRAFVTVMEGFRVKVTPTASVSPAAPVVTLHVVAVGLLSQPVQLLAPAK
jgi:hypothetical protein